MKVNLARRRAHQLSIRRRPIRLLRVALDQAEERLANALAEVLQPITDILIKLFRT